VVSQTSSTYLRLPEKEDVDALDYSIKLADWYSKSKSQKLRKSKGQFFTPKEVSIFMANLITVRHNDIRLLDPGAGVGTLSAAFCSRVSNLPKITLTLDAYENDPNLVSLLRKVLEACRSELESKGHEFRYRIYENDFILHNKQYFGEENNSSDSERPFYNFILANPPYYKLNRESPQANIMRRFISGHPNMYALFMALSAKMLVPNGEMVFITPRSLCSGLYYRKFREWFLKTVSIDHIHIFESRRDVFEKDGVLQENIIIKAKKSEGTKNITISTSKTKSFHDLRSIEASSSDVIFHKNGDIFIRIPSSEHEVKILRLVDSWPNTLKNLGLEISTGPVVVFRTKKNLRSKFNEREKEAPLLWMHNFQNMKITWPLTKNKKPSAMGINESTKSLLLPVKNYVLVKRFSSKEQKRRLYAAVLLKKDFHFDLVGIENHVNYIHKINGELTTLEALGIASLLNTSLIDRYFRLLNGNTQVNATDVRSLPLPDLHMIEDIGKRISVQVTDQAVLDEMASEILGLNGIFENIKAGVMP